MPTIRGDTDELLASWTAKGLIAPTSAAGNDSNGIKVAERDFQAGVVRFAKRCGWEDVYHTFNSKRSSPGFPDCIFARVTRTPYMIAAELKVGDNVPTEDQERWLNYFRLIGVPTFVWWPRDWAEIERILKC